MVWVLYSYDVKFYNSCTMQKFFYIIITLFIANFSFASSIFPGVDPGLAVKGVVKGKVEAKTEKTAIEYANIAIYSAVDSSLVTGTITSPEGVFQIENLKPGKYYLVANFIGFEKQMVENIEISQNKAVWDLGTISLPEAIENLDEVVVAAEKNQVMYQIDKKVVNISKKMDAVGGSLANALENTPSVQVDAEGNITVRGSSNFTVLIDGKPSNLSGNDALKQIPASAVENVEIITNPSAKYDPDGTSGIINIIMKKNVQSGLNGIVNISAGTRDKYAGDFNLNYRTSKANFFVSGSYADRSMHPVSTIDNYTIFQDTTRFTFMKSDRVHRMLPYSFKLGTDLYLSEKTTLTLSGDYGHWGFEMFNPAQIIERTMPVTTEQYFLNTANSKMGGNYMNANVVLDHNFATKGHKLLTSLLYSNWDGGNYSEISEQEMDQNFEQLLFEKKHKTDQDDKSNEYRLKLDYTLPFADGSKFEAGYQGWYKEIDSKYEYQDQDPDTKIWSTNAEYTNKMNFKQNIQAVYATYSGLLAGISYQAGLRTEYTDRFINPENGTKDFKVERFDFFPTLHLSKQLTEMQQLQASYSRRVNRPREWILNPFPRYTDKYVSEQGNPELLPEFTDSYELSYLHNFKLGFVSLEGYYKQTSEAFTQTVKMRDDGVVVVTTENLDKNYSMGGELSTNLRFATWFNVFASANLYSYHVESAIAGVEATAQSINSDFVLNSTFTIMKKTRLQLTGFYNAPKVTGQGKQSEMYGMNMSLGHDFFNNKFSAVLNVRDVFQTQKFSFVADAPNLHTAFTMKMESPVVMLTLSYKINNYKQRKSEDNQTDFGGGGGMM